MFAVLYKNVQEIFFEKSQKISLRVDQWLSILLWLQQTLKTSIVTSFEQWSTMI